MKIKSSPILLGTFAILLASLFALALSRGQMSRDLTRKAYLSVGPMIMSLVAQIPGVKAEMPPPGGEGDMGGSPPPEGDHPPEESDMTQGKGAECFQAFGELNQDMMGGFNDSIGPFSWVIWRYNEMFMNLKFAKAEAEMQLCMFNAELGWDGSNTTLSKTFSMGDFTFGIVFEASDPTAELAAKGYTKMIKVAFGANPSLTSPNVVMAFAGSGESSKGFMTMTDNGQFGQEGGGGFSFSRVFEWDRTGEIQTARVFENFSSGGGFLDDTSGDDGAPGMQSSDSVMEGELRYNTTTQEFFAKAQRIETFGGGGMFGGSIIAEGIKGGAGKIMLSDMSGGFGEDATSTDKGVDHLETFNVTFDANGKITTVQGQASAGEKAAFIADGQTGDFEFDKSYDDYQHMDDGGMIDESGKIDHDEMDHPDDMGW